MPSHTPASDALKTGIGYGLMIAGTVLGFIYIRSVGGGLAAPPPAEGVAPSGSIGPAAGVDTLLHVLLALVVIILTARGVGAIFAKLGQPPVIGEVIAGIMLGPSLLGRVAPQAYAYLLPSSMAPYLAVIAQVGVILYMFLVGLELNTVHLRRSPHTALAISHASIVAPFLLGSCLALVLYPRFSTSDIPFGVFALFLAVSLSVTAFPVLARILTDRRQQTSSIGVIALTCAAVDDVTAWCLLALVVSVVHAKAAGALVTAGFTAAYIAFIFLAVRPVAAKVVERLDRGGDLSHNPNAMALVFAGLLLSAFLTELIGIHALFGAFLLGAVIPHDSRVARELTDRLESLVVVLLLPAFFAFSGMRTQIQLVGSPTEWLFCGLIILAACVGKYGGSTIAARLTGLGWRDASALGILMNTRGLVELIVLNIGLDLKVISPTLFAMLVIMALVTTFATSPIFDAITRPRALAAPQPEAG